MSVATTTPAAPAAAIGDAASSWPAWLRRHTAVELLGEPAVFFAWLTVALSLLAIGYVGSWNARHYPIPLGYDAQGHTDYEHTLVRFHHLPSREESAESNQPPAYYVLGSVAAVAGHKLFGWNDTANYEQLHEPSYRGAQYLNVLYMLLTALCVLWLARVVAPRLPWVWGASVGFFAFVPVVAKTGAMFQPDTLAMLCSAAAVASATHMLMRRTYPRKLIVLLMLSLGLGLATRISTIFTVLAIGLGAIVAALASPTLRVSLPWARIRLALAVLVALAVPWVAYRAIVDHAGPVNGTSALINSALHPRGHYLSDYNTNYKPFFHLAPRQMLQVPWRSNFQNQAFSETYVEIWGDWFGAFAWSPYNPSPTAAEEQLLSDQSYIGVLPTLLAIAGWLYLSVVALRRRRELLVAALLPAIGVGGYLYRNYVTLTHDGDLFKASYVLSTAPVWALGFGLATGWLAYRSRWARVGMLALFVAFAVLDLRFTMYGIRDHMPIF